MLQDLPVHIKYTVALCGLWIALGFFPARAQQKKETSIYRKIEAKANKHKVTRWMYDAVFRHPADEQDTPLVVKQPVTANPFTGYKGKSIGRIKIVSLDPFGYSVNDTLRGMPNGFERMGNRYHINTREKIIRNMLLFEQEKELDPLELSESERILRTSPYVNDARIYVKEAEDNTVDIIVVVQDKWSTIIGSNLDVNRPDIRLIEKNVFGTGHQFEEGISWSPTDRYVSTSGKYSVFNIKNTFISGSAFYSTLKEHRQAGVSFDRPFYSPLAKWAGGMSFTRNYSLFKQTRVETEEIAGYPLDYDVQDLWAAKSFPFSEKKTASINARSKSFIVGGRYYHLDFFNRPSFGVDTNRLNRDQTMYLGNIGFAKRKYYRDRFLYRFGANEDIPEGFLVEFVQGTLKRELSPLSYYSGVKVASGRHFEHIGYLSGGAGYGTFYNKDLSGPGVVNLDGFYFSDLIKSGCWLFREFTRFQFVHGIDRDAWEAVNINGMQMYGFSSDVLAAKSKMILNLELVMYAPYELIGFRFAPVLLCGLAKAGDGLNGMLNSRVYQSYALGLLIRNEYLVTNTFEISIGLYPYMPGNPDFTLRTNPVGSYNVRARDYMVAKPDLVPYR